MSELNITNVVYIENDMTKYISYGIDNPIIGVIQNCSSISISGWAFCRNKKINKINIMSIGGVIKSTRLTMPRSDVRSTLNFGEEVLCGFKVDVGIVGFPENFDLRIRVVFDDDSFVLISKIIGQYTIPHHIAGLNRMPILLNSMGRMGTTMMMRLLKSHPSIVTTNVYPYEERPSQYWTHIFKVLSEPANHYESVNADRFFSTNYSVGNNPFFTPGNEQASWYAGDYLGILSDFVKNSISEYYNKQAVIQGKDNSSFFVEKMMSPNTPFFTTYNQSHEEVKNIFLVRDIRDVYCSVMDFNKKRGYMSFGVNNSMTAEEYLELLGRQYKALYSRWEAERKTSILVKYEDVLKNTHAELKVILDYLGADSSSSVIDDMVTSSRKRNNNIEMHQTSSSPMYSIDRWKKDLAPDLVEKASEIFKDELTSFEYSL